MRVESVTAINRISYHSAKSRSYQKSFSLSIMVQMVKRLRSFSSRRSTAFMSVGVSIWSYPRSFVFATCCPIPLKKIVSLLTQVHTAKEYKNTVSIVQQVRWNNIHLKRHRNIFTHLIRFSASHISLYWQYWNDITMGWNVPFTFVDIRAVTQRFRYPD